MTAEQTDTDNTTRIITLTDAAPVRIREIDWPVIATGRWSVGPRARGWLFVRRHHDDRRVIVYGGLDTEWVNERSMREGRILQHSEPWAAVIVEMAMRLGAKLVDARAIVARLPPVEI